MCCRLARRFRLHHHAFYTGVFRAPAAIGTVSHCGSGLRIGMPGSLVISRVLKDRFNSDAGEDFLPMREAMRALGVSRQTVLQRVKRGELAAVHVMRGKQKGLRIKVIGPQPDLFNPIS